MIPREAHNTVTVVLGTGNVVSTRSGAHGEVRNLLIQVT